VRRMESKERKLTWLKEVTIDGPLIHSGKRDEHLREKIRGGRDIGAGEQRASVTGSKNPGT